VTTRNPESRFRFNATDSIGAAGAEDDKEFLKHCFVDTGALQLLGDLNDNRLIILGRTGAGKSGLLMVLEQSQSERVIRISPEHLALTYVANSTTLNFFSQLGVNLDPFFKLLWRHVIAVEILSRCFPELAGDEGRSIFQRLKLHFLGMTKKEKDLQQALDYLSQFENSFWQDTEYRVKEITNHFEKTLDGEAKAVLGPKTAALTAGTKVTDVVSETEKFDLIKRGQNVVVAAQVQDLNKILGLVNAALQDKQKRYFLVIDGLDENWVDEKLRYKLIMALLHTAREFGAVKQAKIIVALRRDLIERVFRLARDSGFQEEKYQSLYVPLVWTKKTILDVLDRRIELLVSRRYSSKTPVTHRDLLPSTFQNLPIGDYIYSIASRPRDVIAFFNTCIKAASDQTGLRAKELKLAEGEYSRNRFRALADEWSADYPTLADFAELLQKRPASFKLKTVTQSEVETVCLKIASDSPSQLGLLGGAMQVADGVLPWDEFKFVLFRTFYQVGLIGLKLSAHESASWADETGRAVSFAEISEETSAVIHPTFRRTLGIRTD
jgi:hypothetical protein